MTWWKTLLAAIAVLLILAVAALAVVQAVASRRFKASYDAEKAALIQRARPIQPMAGAPDLSTLPAPVRRYLEVTRAASQPPLRVAVLEQTGELRSSRDAAWMPFWSEQVYSADPPAFVWVAEAKMAPLATIWARDQYVHTQGQMLIRLLGAVTVADATGPELDQGAGLRLWGELLAFPELAVHPALRWEAMGDTQARLHVTDGELKLQAVVDFGEDGLLTGFHAQRYRDVGQGRSELTPWSGRIGAWRELDGRLFPTEWESIWHLPDGDFPAVRLHIHKVAIDRG